MSTEAPKKAPIGLGWKVRERRDSDGELLDCFLEAPRVEGMAYGLEVLGDDYTGYDGVQGKLKHCQMIAAWANAAPVSAEPVGYVSRDASFARMTTNLPEGSLLYAVPVAAQPDVTQQTLNDVKAGIPARDAEIEALRKEIETLQAAQAQPTGLVKQLCDALELAKICHGAMLMSDPPQEMWKARGVDRVISEALNAAQAQQPVSGADSTQEHGLTLVNAQKLAAIPAVDAALATFCDEGTADNAATLVLAAITAQAQLSGNTGQLDQFRDAAQMIEPSGNSGELDELKAFEIELRRQCFRQPTHEARDLSWCMWQARATLAQQDAHKVDAERYRWIRQHWGRIDETYEGGTGKIIEIHATTDPDGWDTDPDSLDAVIDAARKEPNQ